jgi:hypothetical protein
VPLDIGTILGYLDLQDTFSGKLTNAAGNLSAFEKRVTQSMQGVAGSLDVIGGAATRAGVALSVGLTAPIGIVGGLVAKLGIDAAESRNLMEQSFDEMIGDADRWAARLSDSLGLNRFEMEKTAGVLFNMTTSMGLGKAAAFEMSTGVVELAADMASFRNIGMDEALTKIRAGLVGETEPLKQIGILVDENTVKTYAYKAGIAAQGAELSQQQKVLARYQAILAQTANDQGDLARTLESPANQLRIMRSRLEETATTLGMSLLPVISKTIDVVASFVPYIQATAEWFSKLPMPVQGTAVAIAAVTAAAGPALIVIGSMASGISAIIPVVSLFTTSNTAAATSVQAVAAASATAAPQVTILSRAMGLLGPAAAVVATALASWQVGKWLGEYVGLTDAVERLAGRVQGLSEAEIESSMSARKAAEAHAQQVPTMANLQAEASKLTNTLAAEAEAQQKAADEGKKKAQIDKEAAEAAEKHQKALAEVDRKIAEATRDVGNLTSAQEKLINSYDKLGLSASDIAVKLNISEAAIQRVTEATRQADAITKRSLQETADLWRDHYQIRIDQQGTATQSAIANINLQLDAEISALERSDRNYEEHKRALIAKSDAIKDSVLIDFDLMRDGSRARLREIADQAQRNLDYALAHAGEFRAGFIDHLRAVRDEAVNSARGLGTAYASELTRVEARADAAMERLHQLARAADEARKASQQTFSFDVDAKNIDQFVQDYNRNLPAAQRLNSATLRQMVAQGMTLQQAIESSRRNLPRFQHGIRNFAGGAAIVGEAGPEIVMLPQGSNVIPRHQVGGVSIVNHFHVTAPTKEMAKQVFTEFDRILRSSRLLPST